MKLKRFPKGAWRKFHSCCDWCYEHLDDKYLDTGLQVIFCGLDSNRDKKMKKFEKGRIIIKEVFENEESRILANKKALSKIK